jgi:hypothetical protein
LDAEPELLFRLRRVDYKELVARVGRAECLRNGGRPGTRVLDSSKIADVFGIELGSLEVGAPEAGKGGEELTKKGTPKVAAGMAAGIGKKNEG